MDYFSQLLESYSKLKKRRYKLTFLSEETMDIGKAQGIIKRAMGQATPHDTAQTAPPVNYDDGSPTKVKTFYKKHSTRKSSLFIFHSCRSKASDLNES